MRPAVWWAAAVLVALAGVAGLARGATPVDSGGGVVAKAPIIVTGAYIREPASADVAAAYFTIYNTTDRDDTLVSVITGAGAESVVHADTTGSMVETPNGVVIPANGNVVFKPNTGHVMIEKPYGPIKAGQHVDISLTFLNAGQVVVSAPVIGIYAAAPTGAAVTAQPSAVRTS